MGAGSLTGKLLRGSLVVGAGILLGNITGFFRVAVTAWLLGTHNRADALAVAIGPLDTLNSILVNTMLFAFVPMLMLRQGSDRMAMFALGQRLFGAILLALSAAVALFASPLATLLGPGLQAAQHEQTTTLIRLFAPSILFAGSSAIFSALLYTERRFLVPGLYQACINAATVAGALLLREVWGINGFAAGYAAGTALHLGLTFWFSRDLRRTAPSKDRFAPGDILVKPGMFMVYAGLIASNIVATRAFATHAGPGMAAAFDYCIRCVNVVVAYLVYPVASSLVPEIARLRGKGETPRAYRLIDKSVGMMAVGAGVACVLGILLRTQAITLLFQRGNFTAESTRMVSGAFLGFAPSIAGLALLDLISRCFFALDRPKLPLMVAAIPVTLNLLVSSVLRAGGRLSDPAMLGVGASAGLAVAFGVLFTSIHFTGYAAAARVRVPG